MRINEVAFINETLKNSYEKLKNGKFEDKKICYFIDRAISDLKKDPLCGSRIPSRLTPKFYLDKFGMKDIWKYDLPEGWRLIYSIIGSEVKIISLLLEWFDHKEYERRFSY